MDIEELYLLYVQDIYKYLFSLCKSGTIAEDLLQDTFYKAHVTLLASTIVDVKPWLFKVAYYTYIDFIRKEKHSEPVDEINQNHNETPETITIQNDSFKKLLKLLDHLSHYEKQAIILSDIQDCTYEQAATILDLKLNTFKSHLARGRKKMRVLIQKEDAKYG